MGSYQTPNNLPLLDAVPIEYGSPSSNGSRTSGRKRPLSSLTVELHSTYCQIYSSNTKCRNCTVTSNSSTNLPALGHDDSDFDYIAAPGEQFDGRFAILAPIGSGSFSKVYKARNLHDGTLVALKVVKSRAVFTAQAQGEITLLKKISEKDPDNLFNCTRLIETFWHNGHQCLVFELLSSSLCELIEVVPGFRLSIVRKLGYHILKALAFLAQPSVNIIHCDLKPENIMLCNPHSTSLQVIDFGSSCFADKLMYSYIQSRFYRSPEVVLGIPYTHAIDMWSMGCILVELHTGDPLFPTSTSFDHVCRMVEALGMPPEELLARAPTEEYQKYFEPSTEIESVELPTQFGPTKDGSMLRVEPLKDWANVRRKNKDELAFSMLNEVIGVDLGGPGGRFQDVEGHDSQSYAEFLDLVSKMLVYTPEQRITPDEALKHPFMKDTSEPSADELPWGFQYQSDPLKFSSMRQESSISAQRHKHHFLGRNRKYEHQSPAVHTGLDLSHHDTDQLNCTPSEFEEYRETNSDVLVTPEPLRRPDAIGVHFVSIGFAKIGSRESSTISDHEREFKVAVTHSVNTL